jgi:hypothetical protein
MRCDENLLCQKAADMTERCMSYGVQVHDAVAIALWGEGTARHAAVQYLKAILHTPSEHARHDSSSFNFSTQWLANLANTALIPHTIMITAYQRWQVDNSCLQCLAQET